LEKEIGCKVVDYEIDDSLKRIGKEYLKSLSDQNALDFAELVFLTVQILCTNEKIRKRWSSQYKFIQIDEFQDTHLSEYLVIKELAKTHRNVSFIGDLDQTIYTWRGSDPFFIINLVKHHFAEFKEFSLDINYRFNKNILLAVKSFLKSFNYSSTKKLDSHDINNNSTEKSIEVFNGYNLNEEVSWVISNIKNIRKEKPRSRIAVLSRTNYLIKQISGIFFGKNILHITVDKYEFFRKQEIKDVYAYLKIIFNKFDLESAYRLVKRPARNIGPATIKDIRDKGSAVGLKVSDFLNFKSYNFNEPFENLIKKWKSGRIIVLDTETTGTNVIKDNIIQIYAVEVINGKAEKDFYFFLKSEILVGTSEEIHGISDDFLKEKGDDPIKVLKDLKKFIGSDVVVGHNIIFDLSMIEENGRRRGVEFNFNEYYDTLDLSRRLLDMPNYKLTTLAEELGLAQATHDAKDDVLATVGLLSILVKKLEKDYKERIKLFNKYSPKFIKLANLINFWHKTVREKRPAEALEYIWENSGLKDFYNKDEKREERFQSIEQLIKLFKEKDDVDRSADEVLRELINHASFNKGLDFLALEDGEIPIVTPHQVKGLEFDYVFVVGMNDYKFPIRSKTGDIEEEKRLFYVSLTRAKEKIFLSYSNFDNYNRPMAMSPFIKYIDEKFINFKK
jgi:DNA helicase-2/ATP-dependent DNA helicase PcrA